jgi:hypothetical protein
MKLRTVLLLPLMAAALSACSGFVETKPPKNLDNACAIVRDRPDIMRALKATERSWNVPVATQMALIYQESKFVSDARPPKTYSLGMVPTGRVSSALGYSQALDGTWDDYKKARGGKFARRTNIDDASDFIGWYFAGTQKQLGISRNDTYRQYLAYHEGRGGYRRGSYRKKPWLLRVSKATAARAGIYHEQLKRCHR